MSETPERSAPTALLSPPEVAEWLKVSEITLRRWRTEGTGPPAYFLSPRKVRYRRHEVEAWLVARGPGNGSLEDQNPENPDIRMSETRSNR